MRTRIYNANILTMQEGTEIFNGELWVDGDKISYVGSQNAASDEVFDHEIDAEGNLIMPGFKNAHAHSAMTFGRNYSDNLKCGEWLTDVIFPMEAKLKSEHIYELSKISFLEYIMNGITACFDMYYEPQAISQLSKDYGFRTVICGALNNFKETPQTIERAFLHYNNEHDFISYRIGVHAEYTTDLGLLNEMSDLLHKYNQPFYVHISETEQEVKDCFERYSKTPPELFESIGLFDFGGTVFHGVHLLDDDFEILRKRGVSVVTCPASNLKLASGIANIERLISEGVNVGIGTDGPSSNNGLDMFKEMYLTSVLQKLKSNDASACPASQVLKMATIGGSRAMGLQDSDVLAVGKLADIIMIDLNRPNMRPINNLTNALVYSANPSNVIMTMIGGAIKYYKGTLYIDEDLEALYFNAKKIVQELISE